MGSWSCDGALCRWPVIASPIGWLRELVGSPWWALPAEQLRVALTLVAMAEVREGVPVVTTNLGQLSAKLGMQRSAAHRALAELADAGFCRITAVRGRGGQTEITLTAEEAVRELLITETSQSLTPCFRPVGEHYLPTFRTNDDAGHELYQPLVNVGESEENPVDREHLESARREHLQVEVIADESGEKIDGREHFEFENLEHFASRPDQDLQRSPLPDLISDLRSPTSRDLSNTETQISDHSPSGADDGVRGGDGMSNDPEPGDDLPGAKEPRRRIDAAKIPERAWAAADYLRAQVLEQNAAAIVGTRQWEAGWSWPAGSKGVREGDGSRAGLRLAWANTFRLLHQRLIKALKSANPAATADDAWNEISRCVWWLFHGQTSSARFRVESPDSLATKWDRIQSARREQRDEKPVARGADRRPDPQAQRQFTRWGGQ